MGLSPQNARPSKTSVSNSFANVATDPMRDFRIDIQIACRFDNGNR
jgi:hypothetical protein